MGRLICFLLIITKGLYSLLPKNKKIPNRQLLYNIAGFYLSRIFYSYKKCFILKIMSDCSVIFIEFKKNSGEVGDGTFGPVDFLIKNGDLHLKKGMCK
ncbi:MAG: hypothetical protein JL50_03540 [Peptococcaceae bacterium BICA1-7]|nr:MAG: hypothetical protein JL50_03540 [Peptococcaceae bacterium BICA1-7]HBV97661.1 hypothetical protein [Desulfotomaculum sp.]